jgi:hypothetical protein
VTAARGVVRPTAASRRRCGGGNEPIRATAATHAGRPDATRRPTAGLLFRRAVAASVIIVAAVPAIGGAAYADSPPVGELPPGPTVAIATKRGNLVAFALPARTNGLVWRIARPFNARVVRQVSEGRIGRSIIVVVRAIHPGSTHIVFALTRGQTPEAFEARPYLVRVR